MEALMKIQDMKKNKPASKTVFLRCKINLVYSWSFIIDRSQCFNQWRFDRQTILFAPQKTFDKKQGQGALRTRTTHPSIHNKDQTYQFYEIYVVLKRQKNLRWIELWEYKNNNINLS